MTKWQPNLDGRTGPRYIAIVDALASRGVTDIVLPATPQRVWEALGAVR